MGLSKIETGEATFQKNNVETSFIVCVNDQSGMMKGQDTMKLWRLGVRKG
jgi:hypothetical protein